jgi:uncharacterized protein YraI
MTATRLLASLVLAGFALLPAAAHAASAEVRAAVNLRTGPGPGYQAFAILPPGTPVDIYECLPRGGWCDVGYGNIRGWISGRLLVTYGQTNRARQVPPPPMFSPPPIYAEPPVYRTPPPFHRVQPDDYGWAPAPVEPGYIEPPPGYVYQPPMVVAPPIPVPMETYPARPAPPVTAAPRPPQVASTPPVTSQPRPTVATPQPATPAAPQGSSATITTKPPTVASSAPTTTSPATTAPATPAKPTYGSAVGKPGAPCKWVNGVCRND